MDLNLRITANHQEIQKALTEYHGKNHQVFLWQKKASYRIKKYAQVKELAFKDGICQLACENLSDISSDMPLYFYGEQRKVLFKLSKYEMKKNELTFKIPNLIRIEELRSHKRIDLSEHKNVILTFSKLSNYDTTKTEYILKLRDITEAGCSFILNVSNVKHFQVGDSISIYRLGHDLINPPIIGEVMYLEAQDPIGQTENRIYKTGIKFQTITSLLRFSVTRKLVQW